MFKIATYNLWNINPPWPVRRDRIAEILKGLHPDVIGFQEVRKYENENQLQGLLKLLPNEYQYVYEKVRDEDEGEEEGVALMSRHPVLTASSFMTESYGAKDNRVCLHSLINITTPWHCSKSIRGYKKWT